MTSDDSELLGQTGGGVHDPRSPGADAGHRGYAGKHPELAERIRSLFPTLLLLEGLAAGKPSSGTTQSLCSWEKLGPGVVFGSYRIDGEVGRGGMGAVYGATHLALDKRVALKVLPIQGLRDASRWSGSCVRRGRRPGCIIPTSCRSSTSGRSTASRTMPCSSSKDAGCDRVLRHMCANAERPGHAHEGGNAGTCEGRNCGCWLAAGHLALGRSGNFRFSRCRCVDTGRGNAAAAGGCRHACAGRSPLANASCRAPRLLQPSGGLGQPGCRGPGVRP